jgi:hypothetical protein
LGELRIDTLGFIRYAGMGRERVSQKVSSNQMKRVIQDLFFEGTT